LRTYVKGAPGLGGDFKPGWDLPAMTQPAVVKISKLSQLKAFYDTMKTNDVFKALAAGPAATFMNMLRVVLENDVITDDTGRPLPATTKAQALGAY